ncbi:TetR/AcrR family transcriptional regulator [Cupriavidus respiraculi]|uniref:TetR/AcrR family transcriptional regulator n=1 Tax=Cupriavidus respiraculi TaxID=195930 RepID=UPI001C95D5A4|nr:TetR/AcrR family transcriptional regulator [Cupriavidus respiraculi]MBY4947701.1 TetR/AcrR family transcriptional regulator [Cupriavidus respiraculi]
MPSPANETAPARRTQEERRKEAETRLLDAGLALVAQKGVSGMTLNDVGTLAGYSRGIVAHHYGSKEKFVRALAEHVRQRFLDAEQGQSKRPSGVERLIASVELYLRKPGEHSRAVNAMLTEAMLFGGSLQDDMTEFTGMTLDFYAAQIRIGIEAGEVRDDVDPDRAAVMILGMLRGVAMQYLLDPKRVPLKAMREDVVATIRLMLAR